MCRNTNGAHVSAHAIIVNYLWLKHSFSDQSRSSAFAILDGDVFVSRYERWKYLDFFSHSFHIARHVCVL